MKEKKANGDGNKTKRDESKNVETAVNIERRKQHTDKEWGGVEGDMEIKGDINREKRDDRG